MAFNKLTYIVCCFVTIFLTKVYGQESLLVQKKLTCGQSYTLPKDVFYDSASLVFDTLKVVKEGSVFTYKYCQQNDTTLIKYRVYPSVFTKDKFNRPISLYDSLKGFRTDVVFEPDEIEQKEELFYSSDINKNGSISRGISLGNNQSVFVNSNLNLQLQGHLTDDIEIEASISDQQVPFQPEGNTQQIQDFDRVFINLKTPKSYLNVGDIRFESKDNYFLKYLKNMQGVQVGTKSEQDSSNYSIVKAGIGISKGKFHSQLFQGEEGVQGPYRLSGPSGSRYIIILSNSEKVFLDGVQMKRGFDNDYVINYNTGEIEFTNNRLITKYSRIRVNFEYSERNYNRTNIYANWEKKVNHWKHEIDFYREADNPNRPLLLDLDNSDLNYLSGIGDNNSLALIAGVDSLGYVADQVRYAMKDTVINSTTFQYYQFSNDPDSAIYGVSFSDVGDGNGTYIRSNSNTTNGTVYEYVGVDLNGFNLGRYLPVKVVNLPTKKQVISARTTYQTKDVKWFVESAMSDVDLNLYSSQNDNDNYGLGVVTGLNKKIKLDTGVLNCGFNFEYVAARFTEIDRFRSADFERDWGDINNNSNNSYISSIYLKYVKNKSSYVNYQSSYRNKTNVLKGFQHALNSKYELGKMLLKGSGFLMNSDRMTEDFSWQKASASVGIKAKVVPSVFYETERNRRVSNTGELYTPLMYFDKIGLGLHSKDSNKTTIRGQYYYREDKDTLANVYQVRALTHFTEVAILAKAGKNQFGLNVNYRDYKDLLFASTNETSLLSRVDYKTYFFKRAVNSSITYTTGTGQVLKRDFVYLNVPYGEGTHNWVGDLNNNGYKDLDEFVIAQNTIDSSNYVKTFIPTDEYVKAYDSRLNYRIRIMFPAQWKRSKGLKKHLSKYYLIGSTRWDRKTQSTQVLDRILPFTNIADTLILSERYSTNASCFFNKSNPKYGMSLNFRNRGSKQLLGGGYESFENTQWKLNTRFNIKRKFNIGGDYIVGTDIGNSDFLSNNNYDVQSAEVVPRIVYQGSLNWRTTIEVGYKLADNTNGTESVNVQKLSLQNRISGTNKRTYDIRLEYLSVDHNQADVFEGTVVGYTMLQGLKKGVNYQWRVNVQQKLSNGLQLRLSYDGRKSPGTRLIHLARMSVSALF